eukprot:763857-Hanusia_phi.AAC.3
MVNPLEVFGELGDVVEEQLHCEVGRDLLVLLVSCNGPVQVGLEQADEAGLEGGVDREIAELLLTLPKGRLLPVRDGDLDVPRQHQVVGLQRHVGLERVDARGEHPLECAVLDLERHRRG